MTQDNTDSSSRQALMYLLFPESRQRLEPELSQLLLLSATNYVNTIMFISHFSGTH